LTTSKGGAVDDGPAPTRDEASGGDAEEVAGAARLFFALEVRVRVKGVVMGSA
jgi:hypothetical protein